MRHLLARWGAAAALSLVVAATAWAADVTGKWTWTTRFNQNEFTQTLEVKQEGEKLTGTITGRNNQKIEIRDGKVKDNEVSFAVVRQRNGQEFRVLYKGKVEGDTIKGTVTTNFNGQERSREWVANRAK